jgi:site-specific DNA recombinase
MLHNELYRGRLIWNRTKKAHRRGTKTQDNRPPEELVIVELPECRIVSNELWEAAHAALERRAQVFVPQARAAVEGEPMPPLTSPSPYLLSGLARCAWCGGPMIAMSRHHGRRRGYFYGCANNWNRGPAICRNTVRIPQEALDRAVVDAMANALDAELVEAAVEQALARLTESSGEETNRRPILEREIAEARRREQRLADAIAQGTSGDTPPEALITALRAEETRRKGLEQALATLPQPTAVVSLDRARVARELRIRAEDMRGLLLRQPEGAREALQALLADRVECTPVLVVGARGYAFTGDGTFGGLLAANTWPTSYGGPNGIRTRV